MATTWDILPELGFEEQPDSWSTGVVYELDLGRFRLSAAQRVNRFYREVIIFSGAYSTSRRVGEIDFELPLHLASLEQCKAFLAYYLRSYIAGTQTTSALAWLDDGARLQHLLPWKMESARYDSRSRCYVRREWLRLLLKDLRENLDSVTGHTLVKLSFDGHVLSIVIGGNTISVGAVGDAWAQSFVIPASRLVEFPKRLGSHSVEIGVYDGRLIVGNRRYQGAYEKPEYVYWMPRDCPTFVMPEHQQQRAGVIRATKGQKIEIQIYLSLLAERIQDYVMNAPDRALAATAAFQTLENAGLGDNHTAAIEDVGRSLVSDNFLIQERLYLAGVTGSLPEIIDTNDVEAENLYFSADLESWANAVTWSR